MKNGAQLYLCIRSKKPKVSGGFIRHSLNFYFQIMRAVNLQAKVYDCLEYLKLFIVNVKSKSSCRVLSILCFSMAETCIDLVLATLRVSCFA